MKLSLDRLVGEGWALDLPRGDGSSDLIALARALGVAGTYAHDERTIHIEAVTADELDASRVAYRIGGPGHDVAAAPLALRGADVDLKIARGPLAGRARLEGHIAAREVDAKSLVVMLDDATRFSSTKLDASEARFSTGTAGMTAKAARLSAQALAVSAAGTEVQLGQVDVEGIGLARSGATTAIEIGKVSGRAAKVTVGGLRIGLAGFVATGVHVELTATGPLVSAAALELEGVELVGERVNVRVDRVVLETGVQFARGRVTAGRIAVGEASLALALGGAEPAPGPAPKSKGGGVQDWSFLDALHGQLDADVTIDANVAIIKKRVATHRFRIPIEGGVIDFRALEHDMSFLEDAVLDFELEGDRLILEKDVPLIPFDNETLVFWQLDDEGQALAKRDKVRIRTLVRAEVPPPKPAKPGAKPGFELVKLDVDPIAADLRLDGPVQIALPGTTLRLGAPGRAAVGKLEIAGAARYRPGQAPEPGRITVSLADLAAGASQVALGDRTLSFASLTLDAVGAAEVELSGVSPKEARATLRGLAVHELVLEGPAEAARPGAGAP